MRSLLTGSRERPSNDELDLVQSGFRYALSLTHNRHDAEDLVQQACLRVFEAKGKLVSKRYLFATLRNLFIDRLRKKKPSLETSVNAEVEITDPSSNPIDVVNDQCDLEYMLGTLQFEEREVLYLNCVEGYSAAEIAAITQRPRGSILSMLSRAKKTLARRFGIKEAVAHEQ